MSLRLRAYRLVVADLDLSQLDISFKVKKTLKPEPNTCEIQIRNLKETSRLSLENPKSQVLPVVLEAGYVGDISQIYFGEVRSAHTTKTGGHTFVTEISTGDAEKSIARKTLTRPVGPGEKTADVLQALARALGVGEGNVASVAASLAARGYGQVHGKTGTVLHGNVAQQITDLCRSCNLEWSVQDGQIQILDRGYALKNKAIELGPDSGLLEGVTVDSKGVLECTTLLIPGLKPGGLVTMKSATAKGGYRIESVEYSGDTREKEWYCKIHAKRY